LSIVTAIAVIARAGAIRQSGSGSYQKGRETVEAESKIKQLVTLALLSMVLSYPLLDYFKHVANSHALDFDDVRFIVGTYLTLVVGFIAFLIVRRLAYYNDFVQSRLKKYPIAIWICVDLICVAGVMTLVFHFVSFFNESVYTFLYFDGPRVFAVKALLNVLGACEFLLIVVPMLFLHAFTLIMYLRNRLLIR
jgi:hypothetical protein